MSQHKEFISFLNLISQEEIVALQNDLEDQKNGYNFFYAADTYDIINYTLPFIDQNLHNKNINEISQFTIAYETIFNNREKFNISLLDEYKEELRSIKNNLDEKINRIPNSSERLFELLQNKSEINKKETEVVREHLEVLTTLYIFQLHGKNIFEKLSNFLNNQINITKFSSSKEEYNSVIEDSFKKTRISERAIKVFDSFVESEAMKLISFKSRFKRHCYLDNTFRDIAVIDRLLNVNKELSSYKIKFKYLSSAEPKTSKLINTFQNNTLDDAIGLKINRSILQLYLFHFITETKLSDDEAEMFLSSLLQLKNLEKSRLDIELNSSNSNVIQIIGRLVETFNQQKKDLENHFFFKAYFKYRDEYEKKVNIGKSTPVIEYLKKTSKLIDRIPHYSIGFRDSFDIIENLRSTHAVEGKITSKGNSIYIPIGKDIVKNGFHHLPYLLFININNNDVLNSFYHLINEISSNTSFIGLNTTVFKNLILDILSELNNSNHRKQDVRGINNIVLQFINLITSGKESLDSNNEIEIIDSLIRSKSVLKFSKANTEIQGDEGSKHLKLEWQEDVIVVEIDYLLLWLYRRNNLYDSALDIAANYKDSKDARIHHGIGLNLEALAYDFLKTERTSEAIEYFNESRKLLDLAFNLYSSLLHEVKDRNKNRMIIKQQVGILNSTIDSIIRISSLVKNDSTSYQIKEARARLDLLKSLVSKLAPEIDYTELHTINHIETELEYLEAKECLKVNNTKKALEKLSFASKRTLHFKNSVLVQKEFKDIESQINELRYNIFTSKNMI